MPNICVLETTVGKKPTKLISADDAEKWIDNNLNPQLERCGLMPECRGCVAGEAALNDPSVEGMAYRTKLRRSRVGQLT